MYRRLRGRLTTGLVAALALPISANHDVPLLPAASDREREGLVRIINHSSRSGSVRLYAIDDSGNRVGPRELPVAADEVLHLNAEDLETGNPAKGLTPGVGSGHGDWRLELESGLDIEVLAYTRSGDGFVASVHEVEGIDDDDRYRVSFFNPGDDYDAASRLRLINPGADPVDVTITGVDDQGNASGEVVVRVAGQASRKISASRLERGSMFDGALGDGSGRWRLALSADGPITVMNLMENLTGEYAHIVAVASPARDPDTQAVPLFPGASDGSGRQGVVRVANRSDITGTVTIDASDASPAHYEPVTLTLGPNEAVQFDADHLETGSADYGWWGIGAGSGDWRLSLASDLDVGVVSFVRTDHDEFLTPMHDTVAGIGGRYRIATFEPFGDGGQASRLRLENLGLVTAEVSITGMDDTGASPGPGVRLSIAAGRTVTLDAESLEAGGETSEGNLGDGTGKWRLIVDSDAPIRVMNLLESPTGHLTNLSGVPTNFAPANASVFGDRFVGKRIVQGDGNAYIDVSAIGRYREMKAGEATEGSYSYTRSDRTTASIELEPDGGTACTTELTFESRVSGRLIPCDDTADVSWRLLVPSRRDANGLTYNLTATITTLPADGSTPDVVRGAVVSVVNGIVRIDLERGGYVEAGAYRYTCRDAGGCVIVDGRVRAGRIVETLALGIHDFDLVADNDSPSGIAYHGGSFYVPDALDDKVYVYDDSGRHIPDRDFDLAPETHTAEGITVADDKLFVVDALDILAGSLRRVFVYDLSGQYLEEAGFDLDAAIREPLGIAHAGGRLFLVNAWGSRRVFAHTTDGERIPAADFALVADNLSPRGIAHGNDRFYVVDIFEDRVYAYRDNGDHDAGADFELAGGNGFARGVEIVGDRFYVVDRHRVFAYPADRPDLVVEWFATGTSRPEAGEPFTLRVTVRNVGHRRSRPTTVSFRRSPDGYIGDRDDEELGTADFDGLAVNAAGGARMDVEAPQKSGYYRYGACVGPLAEESAVRNCSRALEVAVPVDIGGPTDGFVLDADNRNPTGVAYVDGHFHVLDSADHMVYAYRTSSARNPDLDFALDDENSAPAAIAYADDRFYVVDRVDDKVYVYGKTGDRHADADFDLDANNTSPNGIAYGDERLYVADLSDDRVYAYTISGLRSRSREFNLWRANDTPWALEFAEERLYVVDNTDDRVYVYETSGDRDIPLEFVLDFDNASPEGIAFFDGRFYVPDHIDDKVYGYAKPDP